MTKKHKGKKYQDIKTKHSDRVEKRVNEIKNIKLTINQEIIKDNERTISQFFKYMRRENAKRNNRS